MIGNMLKGCVAAITVLSVCETVFAAELVDNPRYQDWAKYKPGTLIKMDIATVAGEQNIKSSMTTGCTAMILAEFKTVK